MNTKTVVGSVLLGVVLSSNVNTQANSQSETAKPKVVNGDVVTKGKYKFVVALQRKDADPAVNPRQHTCGASLLSPSFILTAAHCVTKLDAQGNIVVKKPDNYTAIAGMTVYGLNQGQERNIKAIHVHPHYYKATPLGTYDVAVLELDKKVAWLPKIKLAKPGDDAAGTVPTVAGWGSIVAWYPEYKPPTVLSDQMRSVELPIIADQDCSRAYGADFDSAAQVCTYIPAQSDCQGDSGGPLFRKVRGRFVQVGIVSWGQGCAAPGWPNVYARISNPSIQEFIKSVVNQK